MTGNAAFAVQGRQTRLGNRQNHDPVRPRGTAVHTVRAGCACGGTCPRCTQGNLAMSEPGDAQEREAEAIATRLMSVDSSDKTKRIQRAARADATAGAPAEIAHGVHSASKPLDESTRAFMEPRFGYDFSHVRVHTGAEAADSAAHIGAQAYTLGSHIVFGRSQYAPHSRTGMRLMAHELAHVVQYSEGRTSRVARQCDPAWAGLDWTTRVTNAKAMGGAARNQCLTDMIQEVLGTQAQVHQSTNGAASVNAAITAGNYVELGTMVDRHVNFDRNLNAKTHNPNQYGEAVYRVSADGRSISLYIILGPQALNASSRDVTQMAFDHELTHTDDYLLQWATGTPHAATAGEELTIYQQGFERHFLDLLTIDGTNCSWGLADDFTPLFDHYATAAVADQNTAFGNMQMFYDVRIQPITCNMMKYKIWLQSMLNARPAGDALAQRLNGLPGLGLTRGDPPTNHLTCPTTCT
jgi:uncharacterized protein DUF4157